MKHRIVGDRSQVIAFELEPTEEMMIFSGELIFSKGNARLNEGTQDFPDTGLPAARKLVSPESPGVAGIRPSGGGHLKRFDIGPPSSSITDARAVFALTRGIIVKPYKPAHDISLAFGERKFVNLAGAGAAFLMTNENFLEFTLGSEEKMKAHIDRLVSFSDGLKIASEAVSRGRGWFIFEGPGKVVLSTG
jgi:uncharacterized protein (AIM24 family)